MAKKFTIGLNYFFDNQTNSGIVNYIYNIIAALNTLPVKDKPGIVVFYSANAPVDFLKEANYPFIDYVLFEPYPKGYLMRKLVGLIRRFTKADLYKQVKYFNKIDVLYPYFDLTNDYFEGFDHKVHWLVDFNNLFFPDHYGDKGANMLRIQKHITALKGKVVLSSNALFNELKQHYPGYRCEVKLMRFASSLPALDTAGIQKVKATYNLTTPYFMSPNQFWEHKNQLMVLEALNIIKSTRPDLKFKIAFSGSLEVNRGKGLYVDKLVKKIDDDNLSTYIEVLGVIDRKDQLLLMKGSVALLQPSLYEGWSTLVEEAKALNKFIILSDLPVHREQIDVNVDFFDPHDARQLAEKIILQLTNPTPVSEVNYAQNVQNYAYDILKALGTPNSRS